MFRKGFGDREPAEVMELIARTEQKAMNDVIDRGDSDIQRFYSNATVFVTGGSGFLGKLLIKKLFRSCNIKKIYMLMRSKKGKSKEERFDEMLKDPVFDTLREKQPRFADRIVLVEGDVSDIRLGIQEKDWDTVIQEVDVIFHVAATTRFDESLRTATLINVRGTREVLNLARNCLNLRILVHVSTAYCVATNDRVGSELMEQFYPSPVPPETMIQLVESTDEVRLNAITSQLIEDWPNTYAFTKIIAEDAVRSMSGVLPVCIVRPPIVTCTYCEPAPGWLDMSCAFGATGIFLGVGLGVLKLLFADVQTKPCYMPADYVNNVTIAAGWDAVSRRNAKEDQMKIYNISSTETDFKFGTLCDIMRSEDMRKWSTPKAIWYCHSIVVANPTLHWVLFWVLHYIPAYIVDGACSLLRVKRPPGIPPLMKIYTKIEKLSTLCSYFLTNEWIFRDDNVTSMLNRMSSEDKAIYNFDVNNIDWTQLVATWCIGARKYILKDGLKGKAYANKKQKWLKVAHYMFWTIYGFILCNILYLMYWIVKSVFFL